MSEKQALLVDDHLIIRESLKQLLQKTFPSILIRESTGTDRALEEIWESDCLVRRSAYLDWGGDPIGAPEFRNIIRAPATTSATNGKDYSRLLHRPVYKGQLREVGRWSVFLVEDYP
jgi:CheY-like chemotaxis protein